MLEKKLLKLTSPINGAILHQFQGEKVNEGLRLQVEGKTLTPGPVYVNGVEAQRVGDRFTATVVLGDEETFIAAYSGQDMDLVKIIVDLNPEPRYSLSFDDNIFFLGDIAKNNPKSIFGNFYLRGLRNLHEKYGAKFTLNLFYEVNHRYVEKGMFRPFSLNQFPKKYKGEWEDNADWLRLAFHSFSEFPNRPYLEAPGNLARDFDLLAAEIQRFAGEAYIPTSITHWAMQPRESYETLAERGVRTLCGYFVKNNGNPLWNGEFDTNYCLDDKRSAYLAEHKAWKDFESGLTFCTLDLLFNATELKDVEPAIDKVMKNPKKKGNMVFSTHEQYFWCQYKAPSSWFDGDSSGVTIYGHIPDHFERVEAGIRKATEHGYKPVFLHEAFP